MVILRTGDAISDVASRRGEFADWITDTVGEAWRGDWREHDVRKNVPLPDVASAAGFIITGSASSVTERAPWMLRTEEFIRSIVSAETPLLGICFGHQIIAQALGGLVTRNPLGRETGTVSAERVQDGADPLLDGLPGMFRVNATHVDSVARLPPGARVLARTRLEPTAAYAFGPTTRGVQFHPEIDRDVMRGYVRARAKLLAHEGTCADTLYASIEETPHGPMILRNFVRHIIGTRERRAA